jgi:tRNA pseudouridine38-40 synthase
MARRSIDLKGASLSQKVGLQRAARTDAGVSAAINVLSLKLILNPTSLPPEKGLNEHINSFLPPELRVWSYTRVQGSFHARTMCDSRRYEYNLPTYVFLPPKNGTTMAKRLDGLGVKLSNFWEKTGLEGDFKDDLAARRKWRIDGETLDEVKKILKAFEGSHNFHNFTVGKDFKERSAQRVMKELEACSFFAPLRLFCSSPCLSRSRILLSSKTQSGSPSSFMANRLCSIRSCVLPHFFFLSFFPAG